VLVQQNNGASGLVILANTAKTMNQQILLKDSGGSL